MLINSKSPNFLNYCFDRLIKRIKLFRTIIFATIVLAFCLIDYNSAYSKGEKMPEPSKLQLQVNELQSLSRKKIFFAHQSVGVNIINGIQDILSKHNVPEFRIVETVNVDDFVQPLFAHTKVGANTKPLSKLEEFERIMASGIGDKVDIAFVKFCYVDITEKTDIKEIFTQYVKTMERLRINHPETTFVHVTVPLKTTPAGIKTKIKLLTGMGDLWEYRDNIKRNEFNALILERYKAKEPVFDLAKAEATTMDGKLVTFSVQGKEWLSLYPSYSNDGGHLNIIGREIVAFRLVEFLASLP